MISCFQDRELTKAVPDFESSRVPLGLPTHSCLRALPNRPLTSFKPHINYHFLLEAFPGHPHTDQTLPPFVKLSYFNTVLDLQKLQR